VHFPLAHTPLAHSAEALQGASAPAPHPFGSVQLRALVGESFVASLPQAARTTGRNASIHSAHVRRIESTRIDHTPSFRRFAPVCGFRVDAI
jgi:hypothetical protein